MKGLFELNALTEYFAFSYQQKKIFKSVKKHSQFSGCKEFEVILKDLGIPGPEYITKIKLDASVKEADTSN